MRPLNSIQSHVRHYLGLILILVGLISAATPAVSPARLASAQVVGPSWSYTGNLNFARAVHTATLLPNGKVLVVGGRDFNGGVLNSAELYDPSTGMWSNTGNLNTSRFAHAAALLPNGKVLVIGGYGVSHPLNILNSAELYDPATGTWSITGNLNTPRAGWHTATLLKNGKVLVVGGIVDGDLRLTNSAELYDPATGTWMSTGSLKSGQYSTAMLLPNGKVLVFDWEDGAELYDPATGTWSITVDAIPCRGEYTVTLLKNGKVLLAGGWDCDIGGVASKSAWLYDAATGELTNTGSLNLARYGHTAMLLPNGKVLVFGLGNSAEVYDPASETWSITASLNTTRVASTTTLLSNGKVLVAGGNVSGGPGTLNSAELYDAGETAGPNTVQFSSAVYSVSEGDGIATINVTRTGDTSAPATVKYATSDVTDINFNCNPSTAGQFTGAASRKCDYHIASGRLRFAAGETSKPIILSIVNDVYVESAETLTITLSNPTDSTLASPNATTITITDNDMPTQANPIDGTGFYVRMLYADLLSREPEPGGLTGWIHRIDFCGQPGEPPPPCDRVTVGGDGFLRSGEFFDREFFVLRLYRTGLGRILMYDDVADLAYVSGFLSASDLELNKQELVTDIMARSEFSSIYNSLSNSQFVDKLIQTAAIALPAGVRDGWVNALNGSTKTRAQIYRELSERPEVSAKYLHEAQVVSCYYGFFTRNPDGAYFNYLQRLDSGEINLGDLANAFINAAEYRQRFGP